MKKFVKAATSISRILAVGTLGYFFTRIIMTAVTPVGMNPSGQFVITQPGDTLLNVATVANTGSYNDLINLPTIPSGQLQSDWSEANNALADYIKNKPTIPSTAQNISTLTLSLVGTGATGTQISATKNSFVLLCVSTSTTSTIGGASTSFVTLKICATNNATEASWTTVATLENDQTISLAIALQSLQVIKGQLGATVPAAWYIKLVNGGTGTHAEAFLSGQQTIYG